MRISLKVRHWLTAGILALVVLGLVLMARQFAVASPKPGVRLEFTGYKRTLGGYSAEFQLINDTTNTIRYPLIRDAGPCDTVALSRTNRGAVADWDPLSKGEISTQRPLKAGKRVTLMIRLSPRGPPKQFAILCQDVPEVKRSALSLKLRQWLIPLARTLNIKIMPPAALKYYDQQIWCRTFVASPEATLVQNMK